MKKQLLTISILSITTLAFSQVEIDKRIDLTGTGSDGKITGIKEVTNDLDAANKIYVDTSIANISGGCAELEMPQAGTDLFVINGSPASLAANVPLISSGTWSVFSGSGGSFGNINNAATTLTGNDNSTYVLKWTFTQSGCPTISDYISVTFEVAKYPDGNTAYWTEKNNGFRPVKIGTDPTVFTYDTPNKQYKSGNTILLPTIPRIGVAQPETVNGTAFYGFSGGSASNNNFQWDGVATLPGNVYDVDKVFVSPVSSSGLNYCKALYNAYSGPCNNSESAIMMDNTDLAYATTPNGNGPYSVYSGQDYTPTNNTGSFGNRQYSQQSVEGNVYKSYCVATYGNGWRMPTDIEVGRPNNQNDNGTPALNPGYLGTTNVQMWSTTSACQSGGGTCYNYYRMTWRLNNSSHTWPWSNGQPEVSTANFSRCIYAGGN